MRDDLNAACAAQPGLMAGIQALLLQHEVEQFYHREAALLDERRFEDWLELLADDLSYWMPVRETRAAGQEAGEFSRPGEGALFDETKDLMIVRVRKLRTGFAWAEEPHSRTRHVVSNVRVVGRLGDGGLRVESNFVLHRSRLESMQDLWFGCRKDVLRQTSDGFQVARREIYLDHTVIGSPNLSVFF